MDMSRPADLTAAVARAVQALRTERGWSLDHLAGRSGVSKGVLVAIEQAKSNPNLATLARIGDAFGVPVTQLVETSGEPSVVVTDASAFRALWQGQSGGTGVIIGATDAPWAAELWSFRLEPGDTVGGDAHAAATREMIWVQAGTVTLTVAGRQHRVGPQMCARFPGGIAHRYVNEGPEPVQMIMVVVVPPAAA
jgi:transcriptional regulator with XRE-family HTH domain